jgi:hypothetical protein
MPEQFTLTGVILLANVAERVGIKVQAFDRDMPSLERRSGSAPELLGEATTDAEGRFQIAYTLEQFQFGEGTPLFRSPNEKNADVSFRVFDRAGQELIIKGIQAGDRELRPEQIIFNVPTSLVVKIFLEDLLPAGTSEYERLNTLIAPVIENLPVSELSDEDVAFLTNERTLDRQTELRIEWLRRCALLAQETNLAVEAFYGWGRKDVPDKLDELAAVALKDLPKVLEKLSNQPAQKLRDTLLAAREENIIPATFLSEGNIPSEIRDRIDEIIRDLIRSLYVQHRAIGRLLDDGTGAPMAGSVLRILDLESGQTPEEIGHETTSEEGLFIIAFGTLLGTPEPVRRRLRLVLLNATGAETWSTDIAVAADERKVLDFRVHVRHAAEPEAHALARVSELAQIQLPADLLRFLAEHEIHTLGDIRRAGGLGRVSGLPVAADNAALRALDSHADLSRVSSDVAFNSVLIEKGFSSVADIGKTPLPDFVSAVHETIGDYKAAEMQVVASAQTVFLKNVLTGLAVERANGYALSAAEPAEIDPASDPLADRCGCEDCEAAVSPAAYLADLLGYAATHLKENGKATSLAFLENTFHQPFGGLPTDCEAVAEQIRQVRICIEVLRSYIKANPLTPADSQLLETATRKYLLAAYASLLVKFGTSYEEIRLARGAEPAERQALAARLGIDLADPRPDLLTTPGDEIDQLFLDPDAVAGDKRALTELAVEQLFGLVDTTRDALSIGVKIGDEVLTPELARWHFAGAIWNHNTDEEGSVHLRIKNFVTSQLVSDVEIYRDSARTILIGSGHESVSTGNRSVKLAAKNASGLSGSLAVSGVSADNTNISVALLPKLLVWRLRNLRTIWRAQDFPPDVYSTDFLPAADRLPILDPDVNGPDDFRRPVTTDPLFALWRTRRQWVDQRLQDIKSLTRKVPVGTETVTVPDLDKVFASMYVALAYETSLITPWLAATPISQFDPLGDTLERGATGDVKAATARLAKDLNLSVDAFVEIMRVRRKQREWESDPKSGKVQPEEWSDLFSILVQAQKRRFFPNWIQQEQTLKLHLGPAGFWRSQREPKEGDWPVLPRAQPLIDPDETKLADLPEPTIGQAAIALWITRRDALVSAAAAVKTEQEKNGFDAMLRLALGDPASGDPLQHDLAVIKSDLINSNPQTVASATDKIVQDLHLTLESFNRVMTMREQAALASPRKPSAAEWAELYALLTKAHKEKHLYPVWLAQETTAGLSTEYWQAVKARLPRRRATAEGRQQWQRALAMRSGPVVIDPDLVEVGNLNGLAADAALKIWQARHDWVNKTLSDMAALPKTVAGFDAIVEATLSIPVPDLLALDESRKNGEGIQTRLDQMPLTNPAFVYLLKVRQLVAAAQPITQSEWESVHSILVEVTKRRRSAEWRDEERLAGIALSPDFFAATDVQPAQPVPTALSWRFSREDRFDWLDTLQSRVNQERSLLASFHEVVNTVEEALLPLRRDALVSAAGVGVEFAAKAAWVTNRLVIDAKADGCQKTTRIAQAIETVQGLLFSARTSQAAELQTLKLSLNAPDFDDEWRWIGSYETWRAAMFVFMYPENIAVGSLRRRQTPAFRAMVKAIRGRRQLTSDQACQMAAEYASYYEDVAKLALGATAQATVTQRSGTPCAPGVISKKPLVFMFGRGGVSNSLYWSTFDPADTTGDSQSFWDVVPGAPPIASIQGAVVYERAPADRRVFVFIRTSEHKLQFLTFDLESRGWSGPTDLGLPPGDAGSFDIVIDQWDQSERFGFKDDLLPPILVIRAGSDFYNRWLNPEGTGWEEGDWKVFQRDNKKANLVGVQQLFASLSDATLIVRAGGQIQQRFTNGWSPTTNGGPNRQNAAYVGAVLWGKAKNDLSIRVVQKRTDGLVEEVPFFVGKTKVSEQFQMQGLKSIAPNYGYFDHASFAYERRNVDKTTGDSKSRAFREQDGLYLRLVKLESTLSDLPIKSASYRIAPRVMPNVAGQFSIPARLEGTAADMRRNTVKIILSAASDNATNRTYAEEAYFFVPMLLSEALQRAGEYLAAVDWLRTVYDYASPAGKQKVYYGLVQEETLPAVYKRSADWLGDPLDPHAIAATRRLTYTRFTLLAAVRLLLDFADDEFTRDTAETVPRARALYLTAVTVLNLPELKQQLGVCDDLVGRLEIPIGSEAPAKAKIAIKQIANELTQIKDHATLKLLMPKVREALAVDASWDERVMRARKLVEEAAAAEPPLLTVSRALQVGAVSNARAYWSVLTSPLVNQAAEEAGQVAGTRLLNSVAAASGISPVTLKTTPIALTWLRRNDLTTAVSDVDFVLSPDLRPIAPSGSLSLSGLFRRETTIDDLVDTRHVFEVSDPVPLPPPNPVKPAVVPSLAFCIPPNPLLAALRLHAELNLFKLRTCRNIAGMKRELDPYVAAIDTVTGLPTISSSGQLVLPGSNMLRPTLYRFAVLLQRAKQLVAIAQQVESAMLSAIEKRDAEAYSILRARQDLELAQTGVQLEVLRLKQANDGVTLASLQQSRAQIQFDHYQTLLDEGTNELERGAIELLKEAARLQDVAANLSFGAAFAFGAAAAAGAVAGAISGSAVAGPLGGAFGAGIGALAQGGSALGSALSAGSSGVSSLAANQSTRAQIQSTLASFERRRQEWELSVSLAKEDIAIGAQQVTIAGDAVDIVKQEKLIAEVKNTSAKDTVAFLANKFTNVDLYDWMSGVLEGVYSFFLQQATSTARLAENQLAFERQEPPAALIQGDYWQAPDSSLLNDNVEGAVVDRRGLTGSARLLQDLYRLDQYSFDTNKRKLQLSKTISLALMAPTEFQRFREQGVMTFATPIGMFDRDFPGHYLRLIRSVRTSVVALIPPSQGIHATLSTAGLSRAVIGPDIFQTVLIRRDPELVALTSPINASGVVDLDSQSSGMLLPFEGSGVDTTWELRMPKAGNFFDYRSIGDVLITIEYTALQSWDYSQQIIQTLRQFMSADRPVSFRNQLADQWYDLHNPEQTPTPMSIRFRTVRDDFPANLDSLKIQHVVLAFSRKSGSTFEVPVLGLRFVEDGSPGTTGGAATSIDGSISTRRGNAGTWMPFVGKTPFGEWELTLPNTEEMRNRFRDKDGNVDIQDILFVITYSGRTPEWPT